MAWEYSEKTRQIFMDAVHGKPGTHMGEIEKPDGFGEHGSIVCGDALRFSFRVRKHATDPLQDVITEARYLTFGCTSAIAASEALCTLIEQGQFTPIHALKITTQDIVRFLEGLPAQKIHCSVMGAEALESAVYNWAQKRGVDLAQAGVQLQTKGEDDGRIVCKCFSVTEPYIRRKIKELNLRTIPDITNAIKAGGACASCHHAPGGLQDLLDEAWGRKPMSGGTAPALPAAAAPGEPSPFQLYKHIEQVVAQSIRPALQHDGGDIEVVDVKDDLVYCRLTGACKMMVERTLKEEINEHLRVIAV
ncbi:MAG: iron-sulfur cluster assembly scaffold protein [Kiritimatiellaeota bacterium]|nr:iron-sulfur cluster assembly scaffold protein [Kiritimatiellota bacterium]